MSERQWAPPSSRRPVSTCETSVYSIIEANATPTLDSSLSNLLPVTLTATPEQQKYAQEVATARNRSNWNRRASSDLGSHDQNMSADYWGFLAELLLYRHMEASGLHPSYTLLDTKAVTKADFILNGLRYDVKCAPPSKPFLSINEKQHHDPRRKCDFYVCALYEAEDSLRICPLIPHHAVSEWPLNTQGHSPCYRIHRSEMLTPYPALKVGAIQETLDFLSVLMEGYDDPSLTIEVRPGFPSWMKDTIYPNSDAPSYWQFQTGKRQWFPITSEGLRSAASHALECAGRYEVYFGVLPRIGKSGKSIDVPGAFCLWADIDGGFEGIDGAQARLDAAIEWGGVATPHFSIVSGGGLHVYWLLSAAVPLPDDEARRRFKQILQRLCKAIGGESPAAHADTSRADVASILRVPGTFNRKLREEPRSVRIIASASNDRHSIAWWGARLPALPAPPPPKYPKTDYSKIGAHEGLIRWANRPFAEGKRHQDFAGAAKWLINDVGLTKELAQELLMTKAQVSIGTRQIKLEEVEDIIKWA